MTDDLAVALDAARAGAAIVRNRFGSHLSTEFKGDVDPVTDVDEASEGAILSVLRSRRPTDQILSEEAGGLDPGRERMWIVDPLDGTVNYLHGIPHVAVSVALWADGEPKVGVVIDAIGGDEYVARAGSGATRSGRAIRVSPVDRLDAGLVATGFPYDRRVHASDYARTLGAVLSGAQGIRRFGAAALDFCWVADGRFVGYWEFGLAPWDVAAGILIALEAGGVVTDLDGTPAGLHSGAWIASNGLVHDDLLGLVARNLPSHLR